MVPARVPACLLVLSVAVCPALSQIEFEPTNFDIALVAEAYNQAVQLFSRYTCPTVVDDCGDRYGISGPTSNPSCTEARDAARCTFNECPRIRDTGDDALAAGFLITYGAAAFQCEATVEDLLHSGGIGIMKRPVWESLVFFLGAALVKKFLV